MKKTLIAISNSKNRNKRNISVILINFITNQALLFVSLLILLIMGITLLPYLIHGLSDSKTPNKVTVSHFEENNNTPYHFVQIIGKLLVNESINDFTKADEDISEIEKYYYPLVGYSWSNGKPITVILQSDSILNPNKEGWFEGIGIVRNILWEGLPDKIRKEFINEQHLNLSKQIYLIEIGVRPSGDLALFIFVEGVTIAFFVFVYFLVYFNWRKSKKS
ncbi:MAG: hypothetical protein A2086_03835 [Spirochaetes bacterium GWD1_27_9]|nr:MAG: hypothetical protein A2Z98_08700 [Spirochaetes bacterium GWB1_27_13]OHD30675.1 MAG: hypothetical protein A2086_03835 [Spirochaetes bacterium GWD1_27_9]